jgi:hypothetical protein
VKGIFQYGHVIFFVGCKEVTVKESIPARSSLRGAGATRWGFQIEFSLTLIFRLQLRTRIMTMTGDTKNKNSQTFELGLVMAGAVSPGAYTAGVLDFLMEALEDSAIFASELRRGLRPVHYDDPAASNALFDAWVNRVDIDQLLNAKDLANDKARVGSFLDSTALDEIARTALNVSWARTTLPPTFPIRCTSISA